jgi:hypothetical protein
MFLRTAEATFEDLVHEQEDVIRSRRTRFQLVTSDDVFDVESDAQGLNCAKPEHGWVPWFQAPQHHVVPGSIENLTG